jgi:CSLREA domain-containing protein
MRRILVSLVIAAGISTAAAAATVTVTDSGDSTNACATTGVGTCTLRDAITYANANSATTIAFDISGSSVHTIIPGSPLPAITKGMTIDGYTQPGASANTNGPTQGTNAVILIELDGTSTGPDGGLDLKTGSDGSVIRGLAINRAGGPCINIEAGGNLVVEGDFLGTDPSGLVAHGCGYGIEETSVGSNITIGGTTPGARNLISGNGGAGIFWGLSGSGGTGHHFQGNLVGPDATGVAAPAGATQEGIILAGSTSDTVVGGTTPAERNVVSGNGVNGIRVETGSGTGLAIEGNFVGTDVTGTAPLKNVGFGISAEGPNATIGGSSPGAGNVVSGNGGDGIVVSNNGAVVQGNLVGTDASGASPLGNAARGIDVFAGNDAVIGGVLAGAGNTVAFNVASGIVLYSFGSDISGNTVRGNSIHDNGGIGIDLGNDGVTPNDLGDADTGANGLQNFPIVSHVVYGDSNTTVDGLLNSTPGTLFNLDFYANPACATFPHAFLQGETYIGSATVTTDGTGNGTFHVTTLMAAADGSPISATATDPSGNTSEFSQRLPFSTAPRSGPGSGGTSLTISGTNFLSGATVTIGGQPATGVVVNSYTSISATTPALAAGSANDLVVANTDGSAGTLVKGFVADFLDVPSSQTFYSFVTTLVSNGITAGVGGGLYGVNDDTLRQQMAVFLLKAKHGLCYTPPPCTGIFADVPCSSNFAPWIEAMSHEGITGGCGGGNFCPQNPVRRDQMAVFLLKAQHGSSYVPPMCTGLFSDVPCPSQFANWIEQLDNENITGGCGSGMYCPGNPNTRGQMAVFIDKTFNLQ